MKIEIARIWVFPGILEKVSMPARTNEYQKLVMIINKGLSQSDAKVTESAMLYDSEAGCKREIDILIQSKVSGYDISVGIECTTVAKPVEVRILESFKEKHRKVGINKTIVVSKKGFTKSAKEYANKNHIKLLTFDTAGREKWSKVFEKFQHTFVYGRSYKIETFSIFADEDDAKTGFIFDNNVQILWKGAFIPIYRFCAELWNGSGAATSQAKLLRENELSGKEPWVEPGFDLSKNFTFRDKNGIEIQPNEISFRMAYASNYQPLNSREVEYDGENYVVGAFDDKAKKQFAHFALREKKGVITGSVEVSASLIPNVFNSNP
ncbi:restriction endonuclease [Pseudomonas sp. GNP012]